MCEASGSKTPQGQRGTRLRYTAKDEDADDDADDDEGDVGARFRVCIACWR